MTLNLNGKTAKEIRDLALVSTDAGALNALAAHAKAKHDQFAAAGRPDWRLRGWVEAHNVAVARMTGTPVAAKPKAPKAPVPAFATFTTEPAKGRKSKPKASAPVAADSELAQLVALRERLKARGLSIADLAAALG